MRYVISALCLACLGCGPMLVPMAPRLGEKEQKGVDEAWNNMFSPPGRLDRLTLLDVVLTHGLYQIGVDRLQLTSEKRVKGELVAMEVLYDRDRPSLDTFTLTYFDQDGVERRRERYSRADVDRRREAIGRMEMIAHAKTEEVDAEHREAFESCQQQCESRLEAIRAATQPASRPATRPCVVGEETPQ